MNFEYHGPPLYHPSSWVWFSWPTPLPLLCEESQTDRLQDFHGLYEDIFWVTIFELVRKSKAEGGLALGCDKSLHPVWVREGDDDVEALSVKITVKNMKIRCCTAYGCQENDVTEKKDAFWAYLEEEVIRADASGSGLVKHFDGNLWAGANIVHGDPGKQKRNGNLF